MKPIQLKSFLLSCCFYAIFIGFSVFLSEDSSYGSADTVSIDRIEGQRVFFKNEQDRSFVQSFDTQLFNLKNLGVLHTDTRKGSPYFLFEAKACQNCELENGLFLLRPSGGKISEYHFPGKTMDPKTHRPVLESRAFFGKCLKNRGDVLVFFQAEKVDRRSHLQPSVLVSEAKENHLEEKLIEKQLPSLRSILKRVKNNSCHEIPGRQRFTNHRTLDLHRRATTLSFFRIPLKSYRRN
jgi:hypothetical protein